MSANIFDRIVFLPGPELRYFMVEVARHLRDHQGSRVHAVAANTGLLNFFRSFDDPPFEDYTILDVHRRRVDAMPPADDVRDLARRWEERLGATYNTIAQTNRHFGRGYALGGYRHPRSRFSEETDYVGMLDVYNRYFEDWAALAQEFKPTLMIGGGKAEACMARALGIPYRSIIGSRYENMHYWCVNEFFETPEFESEFQSLPDENVSRDLTRPYLVERVHRDIFDRQTSFTGFLKHFAYKALQRVYWRVRRYEKRRAITPARSSDTFTGGGPMRGACLDGQAGTGSIGSRSLKDSRSCFSHYTRSRSCPWRSSRRSISRSWPRSPRCPVICRQASCWRSRKPSTG